MHKPNEFEKNIKVAVVGGSGYAGLELVHLLMKHPAAQLRACFSTQPDLSLGDYLPRRARNEIPVIPVSDLEKWGHELNTVFLSTPAEVSVDLAERLLGFGVNVVDLSGAFRLVEGNAHERSENYAKWYGMTHPKIDLLDKAEYGLVPWAGRVKPGGGPHLVANPGCYATSVLMAILPLLKRGLVDPATLVIDAKSGTSGGGRKPTENLLFTEVEGECLPYRVGKHQHFPEICQFAKRFGQKEINPFFTTHLLNIRRGIIAGIYAKLSPAVNEQDLAAAYAADYSDYGLVEWGALGELNARSAAFQLSLKRIVGTALTSIHFQTVDNQLYLFSLMDNLVKGAAGQAIENFNRLQGLPESLGLENLEGVL